MRGIAAVLAVLAAVPGCELLFPFDPPDMPPPDAAVDDATPPVDAGPCPPFPTGAWAATSTTLPGTSPTVSADGYTMIYAIDLDPGNNDQDLHMARFEGSLWMDGGEILANIARHDSPALDPTDDDVLHYSIGVDGRVVRARWDGNMWMEVGPLIGGGPNDVQNGTMTDPIAGVRHIMVARRGGADPPSAIDLFEFVGQGVSFAEVTTSTTEAVNTVAFIEMDPHLSPDGCWLLFASDRSGQLDLYVATRDEVNAPFGLPQPLDLSSADFFVETDPWLSRDGTTLYFQREVVGMAEIWSATRP